MLVVVQHPIVDVRSLLHDADHRIDSPKWPRPLRVYPRGSSDDCRTDFIRGLGPVRRRMRGNPSPWLNESYFVDARKRIVLSKLASSDPKLPFRVRLQPVFRRFYSDGLAGKFEIGFSCDLDYRGLHLETVSTAARTALSVHAYVRGGTHAAQPLAHFGSALAGYLLHATTRRPANEFIPPRWWVSAGTPGVFMELQQRKMAEQSSTRLWHTSPVVENTPISCWTIANVPDTNRELLRRLRVQVSHLHADLAALETVLSFCRSGRLKPGAGLEDFLDIMCGKLLQSHRHGLEQREYLNEVIDAARGYHADQFWMLRVLSEEVTSKALSRKLVDTASTLNEAYAQQPHNWYIINGGTLVQEKIETVVHGSAGVVAPKSRIRMHDVKVGGQDADVATLMEQLAAAVAGLRGQVADEITDQANDTAASVNTELSTENPDKPGVLRRLDRLINIAANAGTAGSAVAAAVSALRVAIGL